MERELDMGQGLVVEGVVEGGHKKSGAKGRGAQAKAAAAPALGSAESVATAQKDAKAASDIEAREGKSAERESGPEDAEARMLLKYKTDKSAGSSAYKKHLRVHPDEVTQAREICKQTMSKYRSLLLGKGLRPRGLWKLSPMQKKRQVFFQDRLSALASSNSSLNRQQKFKQV